MKNTVIIFLLFLLPFFAIAQDKWEGGVFVGYSNYLGDMVVPTFTLDQANFAGGVFLLNHISQEFGLRANLFYGQIEGADANYERLAGRGADFESSLFEVSILGEYEPLGKRRWGKNGQFSRIVSPYVFTGVGLGFYNPEVQLAQDRPTEGKAKDLAADYSDVHFSLPIGGGIKFDLSRKINLGLEFGMRFTFSDYLDGLSQGGDPNDNDVYVMGGLTAGFLLGETDSDNDGVADDKDQCPNIPGPSNLSGCPDTDKDGIADRDDNCPAVAGEFRLKGCPDRDGDGIADNVDDCPDNAGLRRFSGCPDKDNDGIVDIEDNCPDVAGIPSMNGCPDADRDGISDANDECPEAPGPAVANGCPDTDADGTVDSKDECPRVPGPLALNGCPDSDNDGIADQNDKCPSVAGLRSNDGCPDIKPEDKATLDYAMRNVNFDTGSATLQPASTSVLDQVAELMSRYPGYKLSIDGYTDSVGNDFANQQLSERRAQACFDYLVSKGLSADMLRFEGHGESSPIASNDTQSGRRQNRRVEFTLSPQ